MNIQELALDWFTRQREKSLSPAEHREFAAWLGESPAHMQAYLKTSELWGSLQSPGVWPEGSQETLFEVIRQSHTSNIVAIKAERAGPNIAPKEQSARSRAVPRRPAVLAALAASLALIALAIVQFRDNHDTYTTARGEQRSIVLPDGSVVQLNTLSRIVVTFDERQRFIDMPHGEAFFRIAHDKARPFTVRTPYATVQALGTEFGVYNRHDATQVAVVEGKVAVMHHGGVRRPVSKAEGQGDKVRKLGTSDPATYRVLTAGQQITVGASSLENPTSVKATSATAWMQRRIVLEGDRVDTAAMEFNRYNARQIQIEAPELARVRITGTFDANDPDAFVKYLQEIRKVRVTRTGEKILIAVEP